jgi:hypothetical protein
MSKHETPLTRRYWDEVGGMLVEEFPAVLRGSGIAQRLIDGVIIVGEPKRISKPSDVSIKSKNIIVLQTKANRLGMNLMGQVIVSKKLMEKFEPKSIRSVAICSEGDSVLELYLAEYGIEMVVYGSR